MTELFNRFWNLRVKARDGSFDFTVAPDDFGQSLRMQFDIKATKDLKYYSATIKIFNLAPNKRKQLVFNQLQREFGTGPAIQLTAGYQRKSGLVFDGAIHRGYTVREPSSGDWVTHLFCGVPLKDDREITIPGQVVNDTNLFSFLFATVDAVLNQPDRIQIKKSKNYESNFRAAVDDYLARGNVKNKAITYSGSSERILREISDEFNIDFYIDHNGFNAIKGRRGADAQSARTDPPDTTIPEKTITRNTGLIGSPIYTDTGAKLITYLQPDLRVFQWIRVESDILNKNIAILDLVHRGDTHDNTWYSEIDGSTIESIV